MRRERGIGERKWMKKEGREKEKLVKLVKMVKMVMKIFKARIQFREMDEGNINDNENK